MIVNIKENIKSQLMNNFGLDQVAVEVPKRGDADLAIPLFGFVKSMSIPVTEVFEKFKVVLENLPEIDKVVFIAGFLNIYLKRKDLSYAILKSIYNEKQNYGSKPSNGQTVVMDYSSPNIAKSFSVGHLRSTVIGNSLKQIYQKNGFNVVGINYLGDWGTQFGRMIVAYQKWGNKEEIAKNPIAELQKLYVRFHEEEQLDPSLDQLGRDAFLKLEQGDPEYIALWQYFRDESLKEFMQMYELLDVTFDSYNGEAFYNDKMDAVVEELEAKGLLKEDQGAKVVYVGDEQPPVLIKRSDGATLYTTRDLAALFYRKKTYDFVKALYIVGNEQKLHFENIKKVTKLMGYDFDIEHVNFGFVLQDGKKMSTRKGKTAKLIDVINEAVDNAKTAILTKNPDLPNKDEVARAVGVGAVIFNDLKNERHLDYEFNLQQMVAFEGQTGPYLQYSIVRIFSILKQSQFDLSKVNTSLFQEDVYFNLVKVLDQFPSVIERACADNTPSTIARYLLSLAQEFNSFYAKVKINTPEEDVRNTNLLLVQGILTVLIEGLRLLGIKHLESM
ncbi:arginine--tRNA ligase [Acholeplasma equirhinis]|uniref:arginine--tRNA ligase n=1 Tax=Acholeplasma equirhinis TaxID=555393 RepID=UPI00197B038D|nr:arginine--tRNA ligase [Acholeplasma equirhinis]MBN3490220.1 arginine--tRNA ligase [Acholeplasma equirhinis]